MNDISTTLNCCQHSPYVYFFVQNFAAFFPEITAPSIVHREILAIISLIGIAKARDLSRLKNAKRLFDNLDYDTQHYVDDSVISKLNSLISAAKRDQEEEEAAERRRRQSSYHSSSTFRSSSSSFRGGGFGGFGGRSGGGGASRGF